MKAMLDCLAIMPVGPRSKIEYAQDTLASFLKYFEPGSSLLLILDDTRNNELRERIQDSRQVSYCQIWCMTIRQRSCQIDLPPVFHPETARCPRPASVGQTP